jgi:uncharacterized flavoprotein (TIGR03862 family)
MNPKTVCIVGTGPSALMAGTILAENRFKVIFCDQKKAPARKFLVAGHGGFNLTNDENLEKFLQRYDQPVVKKAVQDFTNDQFRDFLRKIKIETYVGSSGKIFPVKGIKPIEVLTNWKNYLYHLGAEFQMECKMIDFNQNEVIVEQKDEVRSIPCEAVVLALGGASWSVTGSDGKWIELFREKGIKCVQFGPSNSGFILKGHFAEFSGQTIKNCKLFSAIDSKMGDIVLTDHGIEGAPVYAMNRSYRNGERIFIDLKPDLELEDLEKKLARSKNSTEGLKELKLSKAAIFMVQSALTKEEYVDRKKLCFCIKNLELVIDELRPLDEVISTTGGVDVNELDDCFQLKSLPGVYCVGEMVDWDAPTGGYLIQACVSMGNKVGMGIGDQS